MQTQIRVSTEQHSTEQHSTRQAAGALKALTVKKKGALVAEVAAPDDPGASPRSPAIDLGASRVRVAVTYAGVGFADALAVAGNYPLAPRRPFEPGYEFYGRILDVGESVTGLAAGDRVCGMLHTMGAFRSELELSAETVIRVPDAVADVAAAALPLNYLTALALLQRSAGLETGQSFVIHGAGGGVGTATLELARLLGLRAFGTASPGKHELVRSLGGEPIDYTQGDWLDRALAKRPQGFDAVLDSFGGALQCESFQALTPGGTLVSFGFYASVDAGIAASLGGLLFLHSRNLLPNGRRARLCSTPAIIKKDPTWYRRSMERLLGWAAAGELRPVVDSVWPWHRADDALGAIADRRALGKVLLNFGE